MELAKYNGETENSPIFLSIKGRVYDVTEGPLLAIALVSA
jgi:predicted heme/steroid binding protein